MSLTENQSPVKKSQDQKQTNKNRFIRKYYTREDVEEHCYFNDCWFSIFGDVLDISELIIANKHHPLSKPLIANSGSDISHWFDPKTKNPRRRIDIGTGLPNFDLPQGRFLHVPSSLPSNEPEPRNSIPWWRDETYIVGKLTKKPRTIRIINTLTHHKELMEVPSEETIEEIRTRYLSINTHAKSYTFKDINGKLLDMNQTLAENGIEDETDEFEYLEIADEDRYIPSVLIYFDDDLTEA